MAIVEAVTDSRNTVDYVPSFRQYIPEPTGVRIPVVDTHNCWTFPLFVEGRIRESNGSWMDSLPTD